MKAGGLQHINKRKRVKKTLGFLSEIEGIGDKTLKKIRLKGFKNFEVYPSNKFWIRALDKSLVFIATIGPLTTIPQIWKIFATQSAAGISIFSWASWAILDLPWIFYGILHKDKPIIIAYTLWLITNLAVVIGALLYS